MNRVAILGCSLVVLVIFGCGNDETVIQYGSHKLDVNDLLTEAGRPVYDTLRDDPAQVVENIMRSWIIKKRVSAQDPSDVEYAELIRLNHLQAQQECTGLAIKRDMASRPDLEHEAKTRFEADPQAFNLPESFRLQMIFIPSSEPNAPDLARKILREAAESPDRFAELARQHSRSETAPNGGFSKPMPGSSVHPKMRSAIDEHHETTAPFVVHIDRGTYILRVLEFWPPVEGSYEQVASTVRKKVGRQLVEELHREISAEVAEEHQFLVKDPVFFSPAITANTPVMTIDDVVYTVGEIIPAMGDDDTVTGPLLRPHVNMFQRRHEAILHYECQTHDTGDIDLSQIVALRLSSTLLHFVIDTMEDELGSYFKIHREAFYQPPEWNVDLWAFPYVSGDLFEDLHRYKELIERIKKNPVSTEESGVEGFFDITMTETEVLSYDPALLAALSALADGETSDIIRSKRARAFLLVHRRSMVEAQAMTLDDNQDQNFIAARYIKDNRDEVMDSFFEDASTSCRIDTKLVQHCVDTISSEALGVSP